MRRSIPTLALLSVLVGLFITDLPASAALTSNLIVGGDFTSGSFTGVNTSIPLSSGTWYTSQTDATNTWQISSLSAMAQRTGSLIQAVNISTASYGPIEFSFSYVTNGSYATATLFGSSTQPTYGSFGTEIGSLALDRALSGWREGSITGSFSGYEWYTALFYGEGTSTDRIYIDGVSLKVTDGAPVPLPSAIWLLTPCFIGIVGITRFRKR
jgi:hypothetical protein